MSAEHSPDAFAAALALLTVVVDAPACRARILDLQRQADQLRDLQAKLAGERAAHDAAVAGERAKLDERQQDLDRRLGDVRRREAALAPARVALLRDAAERTASATGKYGGGGLVRHIDLEEAFEQ